MFFSLKLVGIFKTNIKIESAFYVFYRLFYSTNTIYQVFVE